MKINLKQIHENIDDINFLNEKDKSVVVFSRNFEIVWDKIKGNVKDILDYKRELKKLWEFKRKKSQEVIKYYNYDGKSKFYKWIHPKLLSLKNWKYFISSSDYSSSRIESHLDGSKKYTNQEVISSTDGINPAYYSYWPLLISFNLKNALQTWWVLCHSDGSNRVFQFPHKIELPIIVENGMEWTIDVYTKYRSLFDALYKDNPNINIENNNFLGYFSIYDNWTDVLKVRYKINENENMINIISQEGDTDDEKFRLAVFGIVISNGLSLKKDNLVIEIDWNKTFLNDYEK
jgi:hypothetical protein